MQKYICQNNKLFISDESIPKPTHSHSLIKVAFVGLNRADLLHIEGKYLPPDNSPTPGLEVSGNIVLEDGSLGQKVCALLKSGGYSEYVLVDNQHIIYLPNDFDLKVAAALPEAFTTVYMVLFHKGKFQPTEMVLIHGGSSGIGTFAIQIIKAMGGIVFSSLSDDLKIEKVITLGADYVFNYKDPNWVKIIKEKGGVDIVLDILAGEYINTNIKVLKQNGRYMSLAVMAGGEGNINMGAVLMKNLQLIGSTLRLQDDVKKGEYMHQAFKLFLPLLENNKIQVMIDSIYPFTNAEHAISRLASRQHLGKVILQI